MKTERNKAIQGGMDLLAFLTPTSDKEQQETKTSHQTGDTSHVSADWEVNVRHFLGSKGGKATKTDLYNWAKQMKVPPAILYNVISRMIIEGKMVKRFDEGSKELVYELKNKEGI